MSTFYENYGGNSREPVLFGVPVTQEADLEWRNLITDNPKASEIYEVWEDPATAANPAIRQRLAALITAPYEHPLPFAMPSEEVSLPVYMKSLPDLSLKGLRNHLSERPRLAHEMVTGVAYWLNLFTARSPYLQEGESDRCYQRAIYELLPTANHDRDLADQLFGHYSMTYLRQPPSNPRMYDFDVLPNFQPAASMIRDVEMPFEYRRRILDSWKAAVAPIDFVDRYKRTAFMQLTDFMGEWTIDEGFDSALHVNMTKFIQSYMPPHRPYCKAINLSHMTEGLLDTDEGLFFVVSARHLFYEGPPDDPYTFKILTHKDLAFTKRVYDLARDHGNAPLAKRINELLDQPEAKKLMDDLRRAYQDNNTSDDPAESITRALE